MPVVSSTTGISPQRSRGGDEWSHRSESKPPIDMRDMLPEEDKKDTPTATVPVEGDRHSERRGSGSSSHSSSKSGSKHHYPPAEYRPRQSPVPAEYPTPVVQQVQQIQQNHHNYRPTDFDSRRQVVFHQQANLSPTRGNEQWNAATKPRDNVASVEYDALARRVDDIEYDLSQGGPAEKMVHLTQERTRLISRLEQLRPKRPCVRDLHPAEIPRLTKVAPQQPQQSHRDAEAIWRHYGITQPYGRNDWNVATRTESDYYPTMRVQHQAPEAMMAGSIKAPPTGAAPEKSRRRRSSSRSRRSGGDKSRRSSSRRRRRSSSPQSFSPRADTYAKIPAQSFASRK